VAVVRTKQECSVTFHVVAGGTGSDKPRVLVVDDDPVIRSTVAELLLDEGYEVDQAADGAAALEMVRRSAPDAIVLDLMMPVLDGWAFVERCREFPATSDVPIVVMSATHSLHESAERLHAMGVRAVVAKPFDVDALIAIVQRYAPLPVQVLAPDATRE
jgi:CheY-like chemotaxis protein